MNKKNNGIKIPWLIFNVKFKKTLDKKMRKEYTCRVYYREKLRLLSPVSRE